MKNTIPLRRKLRKSCPGVALVSGLVMWVVVGVITAAIMAIHAAVFPMAASLGLQIILGLMVGGLACHGTIQAVFSLFEWLENLLQRRHST